MDDETPPPAGEEPTDGVPPEPSTDPHQAGEPTSDTPWIPEELRDLGNATQGLLDEMPPHWDEPHELMEDSGEILDVVGEGLFGDGPNTPPDSDPDAPSGCLDAVTGTGCVVLVAFAMVAILVGGLAIVNPFSVFGGNSSGGDSSTSQDLNTDGSDGGGPPPGFETPLFETPQFNLNLEGLLTPTGGTWLVRSLGGSLSCDLDLSLQETLSEGFIEVIGDGSSIRVTDPVNDSSFVLERVVASPAEATYFIDLSQQAGMDMQMSLIFTSSTTVNTQLSGCPQREGEGYLIAAQEEPSEQQGDASSATGLSAGCSVEIGQGLTEAQLDELVDCFEPSTGVFIVDGLPDVEGIYFTTDGLTKGFGGDSMAFEFDRCSVNDGPFMTDTTTGDAQVWVGIQEGDNRLMGVLVIDAIAGVTHNYIPDTVVEIETRTTPGDNPWAGWTVFESSLSNNAVPDGDLHEGRITLVCG